MLLFLEVEIVADHKFTAPEIQSIGAAAQWRRFMLRGVGITGRQVEFEIGLTEHYVAGHDRDPWQDKGAATPGLISASPDGSSQSMAQRK